MAESSKATWLTLAFDTENESVHVIQTMLELMMARTDRQVRCSLQGRLEKEDDGAYIFRGLGKEGPRAAQRQWTELEDISFVLGMTASGCPNRTNRTSIFASVRMFQRMNESGDIVRKVSEGLY